MIRLLKTIKYCITRKGKERDYYRDWISEEGGKYRLGVYDRQKKDGWKPLLTNPTIDEIREQFIKYNPVQILEVGCGWGRLMEPLSQYFDIEGCDVSPDMMERINPSLKAFYWDIIKESNPYGDKKWDIVFTRGVILYFMEDKREMMAAMHSMVDTANKAVILWEWPEVIERVKKVFPSDKIVCIPILHLDE
jgi:2-polyprenyl-3-methyl-5-hydroxy-6-metoxy-1,4-benzoquinol methylase